MHPSPGVGRLEKSPSPHLLSHKRFQFKIKVSENWTERGREGFRGNEKVAGKGKRSAFLSERDSPERFDRPES